MNKVAILLSLGLTSFGVPACAQTRLQNPQTLYYLWGGVDRDSLLYWPTKAPDMRPLQLVKAGKRGEAFQYCFSKMKSTKGDLQFFYLIHAASMGFGLSKTDLVLEYLTQGIESWYWKWWKGGQGKVDIDDNLLLALEYSFQLAKGSHNPYAEDTGFYKKYVDKVWVYNAISVRRRELESRSLKRVDHLCVSAVIESYKDHTSKSAVTSGGRQYDPRPMQKAWLRALAKDPKNPELNMVVSHAMRTAYMDGGPDYFANIIKYAESALKYNPQYSRAMVTIGFYDIKNNPRRSKLLLEEAIRIGGCLPEELERARKGLNYLKTGSSKGSGKA